MLAVGGGDGTVSCAAGVALDAGLPLAVFPGGTFNHFAKDIGCDTVAKTVDAIRDAAAWPASTWSASTRTDIVINTASIGAYPTFVQTREKLEHKIGKPLAGRVRDVPHAAPRRTGAHPLRQQDPADVAVLPRQLDVPAVGFRTVATHRMDDGLIDVRILETGRRFSTLRILTSLVLGRLERSPLYHEMQVPEFSFTAVDGPDDPRP